MMFVVFDIECYTNYFLATFRYENGSHAEYEVMNDRQTVGPATLSEIVVGLMHGNATLVTFNGLRYDIAMLSYAMNGATNAQLKILSDRIILSNLMPWMAEKQYGFQTLQIDHIDIINLLPLMESLKLYGARNGTEELQDLPFTPDSIIDVRMAAELRKYCRKDCKLTHELFESVSDDIDLRITLGKQYNQDLRSKSDAQIAEAVMKSEYKLRAHQSLVKPIDAGTLPTHVKYIVPEFVRFDDEALEDLVTEMELTTFELLANGKPKCPEWLKGKTMLIDNRKYAVGLGGLHAKNKKESYYSTPGRQLIDIDVASYYPSIILNCQYQPSHMGSHFTDIYKEIVDQRLIAKRNGDKVTSAGLKITINGTYGKLGSPYSAVYSPELMLAVTFTGQLALLMLIEFMAQRGIQCVSANTDGVTIMATDDLYKQVVCEWENVTGFAMEYTYYKSIHYRDVNSYFALTMDGDLKTKGVFRSPALNKNPDFPIIQTAVIRYTLYGEPIERTIGACQDIHQFLAVRTVRGGAVKDGEYLGKAVRWYCSKNTDTAILYLSNGNQVAKTDNAMPMMDLVQGMPDDIDLEWYAYEAHQTLNDIGHYAWA